VHKENNLKEKAGQKNQRWRQRKTTASLRD